MALQKTYHVIDNNGVYIGCEGIDISPDVSNVKVSVIVPIYNVEQFLDQALRSIRDQTHRNLEIICINDGSTDGSLEIIRAHAVEDDRIVVIDKPNEGYGASCNRGIAEASGNWIAIVEPDDWIEPGMYEDMLHFASSLGPLENVDIIKTPYWQILDPETPAERKMPCSYARRMRNATSPLTLSDAPCLVRHHPSIWSAIYRKDFLDDKAIRFKPIPGAGWADNPFLIETLAQAESIVYVNQAYYCYRADTDEKSAAFHKNNPEVPLLRWLEMTEILKRLEIDDEGILRAHHERGFTYVGGVLESHTIDEPTVKELVSRVFAEMDADIVLGDVGVSPAQKKLFCATRGLETPKGAELGHLAYLARQSAYSLGNVGPRELAGAIKKYVTRYNKRAGKGSVAKD